MDTSKMVFVFGSNEGGIHGAGAASYAYKKKGARWGFSYGHMGDSFAIPTKSIINTPRGSQIVGQTLSLEVIQGYVDGFISYAKGHPELNFQVTCIGCGLAGLDHDDVAFMFDDARLLKNVYFDRKWEFRMGPSANYWGEG